MAAPILKRELIDNFTELKVWNRFFELRGKFGSETAHIFGFCRENCFGQSERRLRKTEKRR